MTTYKGPAHQETSFNCPSCGAFAQQVWSTAFWEDEQGYYKLEGWEVAVCNHCDSPSFWQGDRMIYPFSGSAPLPNVDLPDDIREDYEEARSIATLSPRGAAALLRLVIQKLCRLLGESGENINTDIARLVKKGLDPRVQKALDIVRVVGNNAVHPGVIDITDDQKIVGTLFDLINLIADKMISEPKHLDTIFEALPENQRQAIARRDAAAREPRREMPGEGD